MKKSRLMLSTLIAGALLLSACASGTAASTQAATTTPAAATTAAATVASTETTGTAASAETTEAAGFQPADTVTWMCTSSAGGNSDMFSRIMADLATRVGGCNSAIVVENITDGGGAVGQRQVAGLTGKDADNTLLTFTTGDLPSVIQNTDLTVDDFQPLGTLLSDLHMIYVPKDSKWQTFQDFVDELQDNDIVLAGSKGDDIMFYNVLKSIIDPNDHLSYLQFTATNETATAVLGGHAVIGIGKPAVCTPYIENGDFRVLGIEGNKNIGGAYENVPLFSELGYPDISFIQFRSVFASRNISPEALAYWEKVFKNVADSKELYTDYADKYGSTVNYMNPDESRDYYNKAQENCKNLLN